MKHRGSGGFAAMKRWSARLFERLRRDESVGPHGFSKRLRRDEAVGPHSFSSGFAAMKRWSARLFERLRRRDVRRGYASPSR
jgi:hypothetical protein